jgi:hypothetical protein
VRGTTENDIFFAGISEVSRRCAMQNIESKTFIDSQALANIPSY